MSTPHRPHHGEPDQTMFPDTSSAAGLLDPNHFQQADMHSPHNHGKPAKDVTDNAIPAASTAVDPVDTGETKEAPATGSGITHEEVTRHREVHATNSDAGKAFARRAGLRLR